MTHDDSSVATGLDVPRDDGAADHLPGLELPAIELPSTDGSVVDLSRLTGSWVIYVYPMIGKPGVALPEGWDEIPGARGCTPQSCSFRDHYAELAELDTDVLGLSVQESGDQREAKDRLNLPFELLSDSGLKLKHALRLPVFEAEGVERYKRLTMISRDGRIEKVFYPVFPPGRNAEDVLEWLRGIAR